MIILIEGYCQYIEIYNNRPIGVILIDPILE